MYLRTLEDERKFRFHSISSEEKAEVIKLLTKALSKRREILLAVIFGSFTFSGVFRDIDVAVFIGYAIPYDKVEQYEEELALELESLVKKPVDVWVIDYAPPWFRVRALEGIVLIEKQPALATKMKFKALQEINDLKAKIKKLKHLKTKGTP